MEAVWLILALGAVTYLTRISGHLLISAFGTLHPRVTSALDAVPAAVITTIVIPPVIDGGLPERITFVVAILLSFRFGMIPTIAIALVILSGLRQVL